MRAYDAQPGNCAGVGIRVPGPTLPNLVQAPLMLGPRCQLILRGTWSSFRPAVPARTTTAACKGDNNGLVPSLRCAPTGKFVWGFQVVHHDLWDYDVAAQPLLLPGKTVLRRLPSAQKWAMSLCSTGSREFRCFRWKRDPFLRRISRAKKAGPRSHFPQSHWCRKDLYRATHGEPRPKTPGGAGQNQSVALGGHFYSAQSTRDNCVPRQCGWGELGQRGLRFETPCSGREHESPYSLGEVDSAREIRKRDE